MHSNEKKKNTLNIIILIIYLVLFITVGMTLVIFQPPTAVGNLTNPPDEFCRFYVPRYIYEHNALPNAYDEAVRIPAYGNSYALFPMLPYIVQAIGMKIGSLWNDSADMIIYYGRVVNLIMGIIAAVLVYLLSKELFKRDAFRWLFCFLVMFEPQHLFVYTYVNTDAMSNMSCILIALALTYIYKRKMKFTYALYLSLGVIMCVLSYYNAYGHVLVAILLCIIYFMFDKENHFKFDYKNCLKWAAIITVMVLAGSLWHFIRNGILYNGDFLGFETSRYMRTYFSAPEANILNFPPQKEQGVSYLGMIFSNHFLPAMVKSYICTYGSMIIDTFKIIYVYYTLLYAVGLFGSIYRTFKAIVDKKTNLKTTLIHCCIVLSIGIPVFLLTYYAYTSDYQYQGRYILPAVVPLSFYVVRGVCYLLNHTKLKEKQVDVVAWILSTLIVVSEIVIVYATSLPQYLEPGAFYYLI